MRGKRLWDSLGGLDKVGEAVVEASCMSVTRAGVVVFHLCAGWLLLRVAGNVGPELEPRRRYWGRWAEG